MPINWNWLDRRLERKGINYHTLHHEYGFHHATLKGWDEGRKPRMHTLRKLARILDLPVDIVMRNLGVNPVNAERK